MLKSNVRRQPFALYNDPRPRAFTNELKYVDTAASSTGNAAGVWTKITLPPQGVTSVTRLADRAHIIRLEHQAYLTTGSTDMARVIIIQTKGLFTSAPATTDLLASASPISPYVYNARALYEVISDECHNMTANGDSGVVQIRKSYQMKIPDLQIISGATNVYDGQLYMLVINLTTGNVSNVHNFRLWFEDAN